MNTIDVCQIKVKKNIHLEINLQKTTGRKCKHIQGDFLHLVLCHALNVPASHTYSKVSELAV